MFGPLGRFSLPFGSSAKLRQDTSATIAAQREMDALAALESPNVDTKAFGDRVLVTLEDDGRMLHVRSITKGTDYRWIGRATPKASVFQLFPYDNEIDRQKFIDFVYNFHYVVFDLTRGSFEVLDSEEADALLFQNPAAHSSARLLMAATR